MRLPRRSLAPAGLLAALVAAGVAVASAPTARPEPAEPYRAKPAVAGDNITFLLKDNPGLGREDEGYVFFEVAGSKERDSDGTLKSGTLPADPKLPKLRTFQRKMKWNPKLGRFSYTLPAKQYKALRDYWAKTPGTYYWAPFVVNCAAAQTPSKKDDCAIESRPVNSFDVVESQANG